MSAATATGDVMLYLAVVHSAANNIGVRLDKNPMT